MMVKIAMMMAIMMAMKMAMMVGPGKAGHAEEEGE